MSQIRCPHCNELILIDGRFCKLCGGDLEIEILKLKQEQLPINFQVEETEKKKQKEKRDKLIISSSFILSTLSVIVLLVVIYGFHYYATWIYVLLGILVFTSLFSGYLFRKFYIDQRKTWFKCLQLFAWCM
jgi:hypothetical protein